MTDSTPAYSTRLLDRDTWDDFAGLVEASNGVWGGCWCIGLHVDAGTLRQVLVYDGGGVVEAYPEQTEGRGPQRGAYLHTGPEELYLGFGFTRGTGRSRSGAG